MKIPLLSIRKKRGRKAGSPLKNDATLVNLLSRLPTVNDYDAYEGWKREFKDRLGYFLIDETIEKAEEVYHVRFRVKVEKLVRVISKIAHHVNDGSLCPANLTIQARNSLHEGMKSCEDISTYLKVLSPMNLVEEKIVGFTKYNTASILVETGFGEYERLNMCRDILQVLRENFVDPVAEPKHINAFDKYEEEIISFKTFLLDEVGLVPVLKKQRQLKSPIPPKALVTEIRRGVLRKALVSKSPLLANRSRDSAIEANKTKKSKKKTTSKSPLRRQPKSKSPKTPVKKSIDDAPRETRSHSQPRRKKSSKSPKRKPDDAKPKADRFSSRRRATRNMATSEDDNGEDTSRNRMRKTSLHNRSSHLNTTKKSKPHVSRDAIRVEKSRSPSYHRVIKQHATHDSTASHQKSDSLVIFPRAIFSSKQTHLSEDEKSMSSVQKKNISRLKATKVRKGKPLLKSATRERNRLTAMRGQKAFHKQEFTVNSQPVHHDTANRLFETTGDGSTFESLNHEDSFHETLPRASRSKNTARSQRHQSGSNGTGSQFESNFTFQRCDSFELIETMQPETESPERPLDAPINGKKTSRKKKLGSKSSNKKKNLFKNDDYKKIIHRKAYPASAKIGLPRLTMASPFPVQVSDNNIFKETLAATANDPIRPKFQKSQAASDENLSSVFLSSLLGSFDSPRRRDDEPSKIFQHTTPYESINLLKPPLHGHEGSTSAFTSLVPSNAQKSEETMSPYGKNYIEKPSFYENFVKPLTSSEHDSIGNHPREWTSGREIFEDPSVCSSRYVSSQKSMDEAISKFNSDETIIELQRLNERGKRENSESDIQRKGDVKSEFSSPTVTRKTNEFGKGVSLRSIPIEWQKAAKRGSKKINFDKKQNLFEDTGDYSPRHQAKVLTAEEEAARMADEVAKLQIALEDNQQALFCSGEEAGIEEDSGSFWKVKEESDELLAENMLKLKIGEDNILLRWNHDDEEREENNVSIDDNFDVNDEEDYYREVELKMTKKGPWDDNGEKEKYKMKGDELQIAANILKVHSSTGDVLNINDNDVYDHKQKGEAVATNEKETEATVNEALDMVEKMLSLESSKEQLQKEDLLPPESIRGSSFHTRGTSPKVTAKVLAKKNIDARSGNLEMDVADGFGWKHRRTSSSNLRLSEQPKPTISRKPTKKSENSGFFTLESNESLSTRYFDRSTKGNESLPLATSQQKSKYGMGHRSHTQYSNMSSFKETIMNDDKMMAPRKGVSVRAYDTSIRLGTRWQTPQEKKRVI